MRSNWKCKITLRVKMEFTQKAAIYLPHLLRMLRSLQKLALRRLLVRRTSRMSGQMSKAAARLTSSKMQKRMGMTYLMRSSR
jgi:hypothetical protein